jgi:hypothetical protein
MTLDQKLREFEDTKGVIIIRGLSTSIICNEKLNMLKCLSGAKWMSECYTHLISHRWCNGYRDRHPCGISYVRTSFWIKSTTIKMVSVAYPLSTQY